MKAQRIKQCAKIAEGGQRGAGRADAEGGAGDPIEHPDRHDGARVVRHLTDGHELSAPVLHVENRHSLPREWVPRVVNLARVTDAGRMKRALSSRARCAAAAIALGAVRTPSRSS
jgi:hypothetical protein